MRKARYAFVMAVAVTATCSVSPCEAAARLGGHFVGGTGSHHKGGHEVGGEAGSGRHRAGGHGQGRSETSTSDVGSVFDLASPSSEAFRRTMSPMEPMYRLGAWHPSPAPVRGRPLDTMTDHALEAIIRGSP